MSLSVITVAFGLASSEPGAQWSALLSLRESPLQSQDFCD